MELLLQKGRHCLLGDQESTNKRRNLPVSRSNGPPTQKSWESRWATHCGQGKTPSTRSLASKFPFLALDGCTKRPESANKRWFRDWALLNCPATRAKCWGFNRCSKGFKNSQTPAMSFSNVMKACSAWTASFKLIGLQNTNRYAKAQDGLLKNRYVYLESSALLGELFTGKQAFHPLRL